MNLKNSQILCLTPFQVPNTLFLGTQHLFLSWYSSSSSIVPNPLFFSIQPSLTRYSSPSSYLLLLPPSLPNFISTVLRSIIECHMTLHGPKSIFISACRTKLDSYIAPWTFLEDRNPNSIMLPSWPDYSYRLTSFCKLNLPDAMLLYKCRRKKLYQHN